MKNMTKVETAMHWLNEIYFNGDQDECSLKHVINGLCLLKVGKTPTNQDNFVDYKSSGFSKATWDLFGDRFDDVEWFDVYEPHLWSIVENLYKDMSDGEKSLFMKQAHPFGDIEDDLWMEYYK